MLKTVTVAPDTTVPASDQTILETVIPKYIAAKHGGSASSLEVSVSKIDGDFAKGMVSDQGGGGLWFAAKEDGLWKLVWDGNGMIQCSTFSLYPNFSTSLVPECWDDNTQAMVKR
ncbi:MAG: hypothetical protein M1484_00810 [Patescibacteria group bacterium]|nr:hypothetical protein [Patescibacteria group bacterium]MCL5431620.1 hypothetical protein [Patescibacteria group bacterium]